MFSRQKNWLTNIDGGKSRTKSVHSLENLKYLYGILLKNQMVNDQNCSLLVETLRSISEILIWGDQNDSTVFDFFLEKNMLVFFLKFIKQRGGASICVQLLQTLNILFENISDETSIYYLLSNNHVNSIIVHKFDFSDEEVMAYYISFLKTLSIKLNKHTVHFFYNEHTNDFALYTEALKFFNHSESMVRIAVRTITLNVYRACLLLTKVDSEQVKVNNKDMLGYINEITGASYFVHLISHVASQIVDLHECIRQDTDHRNREKIEYLTAEHLDHLHYLNDILSLNIQLLNQGLVDQLFGSLFEPLYIRPLLTPHKHVKFGEEQVVSIFLLSQVYLTLRYDPIIIRLTNILFGTTTLPDIKNDQLDSQQYKQTGIVPLKETNSTDEEKLLRTQSGSSLCPKLFHNRAYLCVLLSSLDSCQGDHLTLVGLCLFYAIEISQAGIELVHSLTISDFDSQGENGYDGLLVNALLSILSQACLHECNVRLATLELAILLLKKVMERRKRKKEMKEEEEAKLCGGGVVDGGVVGVDDGCVVDGGVVDVVGGGVVGGVGAMNGGDVDVVDDGVVDKSVADGVGVVDSGGAGVVDDGVVEVVDVVNSGVSGVVGSVVGVSGGVVDGVDGGVGRGAVVDGVGMDGCEASGVVVEDGTQATEKENSSNLVNEVVGNNNCGVVVGEDIKCDSGVVGGSVVGIDIGVADGSEVVIDGGSEVGKNRGVVNDEMENCLKIGNEKCGKDEKRVVDGEKEEREGVMDGGKEEKGGVENVMTHVETILTEATIILRYYFEVWLKSEEIFLDMFEDEYREFMGRPLRVEFLTMEASVILPPISTPLTGIHFCNRLPCGEVERARKAMRAFFLMRSFHNHLHHRTDPSLPLTNLADCVQIGDVLDLNNSDLIACTVVQPNKIKERRFLVIDIMQLILVEPDSKKLGWGLVKFVAFLQDTEVAGDKDDSRCLQVTIHKASTRTFSKSVPSFSSKFLFDDHIRCMAARQRLTKGRLKARQRKMHMICKLVSSQTTPSTSSFTHFSPSLHRIKLHDTKPSPSNSPSPSTSTDMLFSREVDVEKRSRKFKGKLESVASKEDAPSNVKKKMFLTKAKEVKNKRSQRAHSEAMEMPVMRQVDRKADRKTESVTQIHRRFDGISLTPPLTKQPTAMPALPSERRKEG